MSSVVKDAVGVPLCTIVSRVVAASIHFGTRRVLEEQEEVHSKKRLSPIQLTEVMSVNRSPPK